MSHHHHHHDHKSPAGDGLPHDLAHIAHLLHDLNAALTRAADRGLDLTVYLLESCGEEYSDQQCVQIRVTETRPIV